MSFDLNVLAKNIEFDPKKWEAEIAKHLKGFSFDAPDDWSKHSGFLPARWINTEDEENPVESGFEFSFEEVKSGGLKKLFNKNSNELEFLFSFSTDKDEFKTGWIAAGALATILNATLTDPQEDKSYTASKAMNHALKIILQPKKPKKNPYDSIDFQALAAFQKTNEKEIHKIAKEIFTPEKIVRRGTSKIWLDDQGWYTTIIEFLPSRHGYGMIVNIAVHFHWDEDDSMSYDFSLENNSPTFKNEKEYTADNKRLVNDTLKKVLSLRMQMTSLTAVKNILIKTNTSYEPHKSFHLAILSGLMGDLKSMEKYVKNVLATEEEEIEWRIELKKDMNEIHVKATDKENFCKYILECIATSRALNKMPEMKVELPG